MSIIKEESMVRNGATKHAYEDCRQHTGCGGSLLYVVHRWRAGSSPEIQVRDTLPDAQALADEAQREGYTTHVGWMCECGAVSE